MAYFEREIICGFKEFGHGGSDFHSMYHFIEKIRGNEDADVIDVYVKVGNQVTSLTDFDTVLAEYEANKNSNKKEEQDSEDSSSGGTDGNEISYITDMSQVIGTDAFSIVYDGYEITDSYPNSGDDILMAMDATSGKLLMVTKYKVTNISGQTENFDMFSKKGKFRLDLNGERYKSQYTLLLDDLSMYKGDIESGESIDTVLIFEVPEATVSNISDMVLSITVGDEVSSMQLQGGSSVMWTETVEPVWMDFEQGSTDENIDSEIVIQDSNNENIEESGYNDLAEEYLNAIEAENAGLIYDGGSGESQEGGNVTVVGSDRN